MAETPPEPGDTPKAGNKPDRGIKRSQPDLETTASDPNIKEEPDAKKPKLEAVAAQDQQPLKTIDIDPAGDLLIVCTNLVCYKVDSAAIKRAAPKLYEDCLAARVADGSSWTFKYWGKAITGERYVLEVIHANLENIHESLLCHDVRNAVCFAKRYEFLGRFSGLFKQWYRGLGPQCCPPGMLGDKVCKCGRLWTAHHLGLEKEFKTLQRWAVFNLCADGTGALGDPFEQYSGKPLKLSSFFLSDQIIIDRLVRLQSEAVNLIMTSLTEVQLALIPAGHFGKDGRINNKFGGCACLICLDLWLGRLTRSLLRPSSSDSAVGRDLPRLSPPIEAKEYRQPLEKLCAFVDALQTKMQKHPACNRKGQAACTPPQLVGRKAVEDLINRGLQAPLSAT